MRRLLFKLFRLKNILFFTIFIITIYFINNLKQVQNIHTRIDLPPIESYTAEKIDWHDYEYIKLDADRKGMGEHGSPAKLDSSESALEEQLYAENGFNGALSDKISVNRSLPDIRHPGCQSRKYISKLPTVSVVVPFHNEHWSTLLRTVHSVLNRSPSHLIKEIFLVDDASTKDFLGTKLEEYMRKNAPKVQVLRIKKRSGLITARLAGARAATADVLIFLDSHTEANVNWLPPLLEPIALNYRTAVCPFIDVVAYDTFEYRAQDEGARGAFDWEFFYKRLPVLPDDKVNMPEPFRSPVMAGGLFAISRKFFWELGGYDEGLDIWGGEQYELSFKVWQCGGQMLDAPCSRVGHIYRKFAPFPNPGHGDFVGKNYRRVAEVWMDEYAQYLYKRRPHYLSIAPGDLSAQRAVRERLHCKPFSWFMTHVAFDLPAVYPPVEPDHFGEGKIRSVSEPQLCIDAKHGKQMDKLYLSECDASGEMDFVLTWHKDIRCKERAMCWDVPESKPNSSIILYTCHLGGGNQLWRYHEDTQQLKQGLNDRCLEYDASTRAVYIARCGAARAAQRWSVERLNREMMAKWGDMRRVTGPPRERGE